MALIKCPECGKGVSDKASSCPNCGCPLGGLRKESDDAQTSVRSLIWTVGIVILIFLWWFNSCNSCTNNEQQSSTTEGKAAFDTKGKLLKQIDELEEQYRGTYKDTVVLGIKFDMTAAEFKNQWNILQRQGYVRQMSASGLTAYCFKGQPWDNDYYYAVVTPSYANNKITQIQLTIQNLEINWDCYSSVKKWLTSLWGEPKVAAKDPRSVYWFAEGLEIIMEEQTVQLEDWHVPEKSIVVKFKQLTY